MGHSISVEGRAFDLRPIQVDDAELVVRLRSDRELSRYLPALPDDVAAQRRWLESYLEGDNDYYFAIDQRHDGRTVGVIGLYDVDQGRAEWGRWVLEPGSLGGVESAQHIYTVGFDQLGLREMYCRTATANEQVLKFHDSCGLTRVGTHTAMLTLDDGPADACEHQLLAADAPATIEFLDGRAQAVARLFSRGSRQ